MAKGRRNRLIRETVFGSKRAARRIRKDRNPKAHDTLGRAQTEALLKEALEARYAKSGLLVGDKLVEAVLEKPK